MISDPSVNVGGERLRHGKCVVAGVLLATLGRDWTPADRVLNDGAESAGAC